MITVGSAGLVTQEVSTLGNHLKSKVFCNQRCQVQLVSAFFLRNALGDVVVLDLGLSIVFSETSSRGISKMDFALVLSLEEAPLVRSFS